VLRKIILRESSIKKDRYTLIWFVALFLSIIFAFGGITVLRQGAIVAGMVVTKWESNIFIGIPENRSDLQLIEKIYPGGTWEEAGRRYKK